jgi:hypothetical protein
MPSSSSANLKIARRNERRLPDRRHNYLKIEEYHFEKWGFPPDFIEIDGIKTSHFCYGLKL